MLPVLAVVSAATMAPRGGSVSVAAQLYTAAWPRCLTEKKWSASLASARASSIGQLAKAVSRQLLHKQLSEKKTRLMVAQECQRVIH